MAFDCAVRVTASDQVTPSLGVGTMRTSRKRGRGRGHTLSPQVIRLYSAVMRLRWYPPLATAWASVGTPVRIPTIVLF
jgi:hypothetical protein